MVLQLARHDIRGNSVAPTFVSTPLTESMLENPEFKGFVLNNIPLGKLAEVSDVAHGVLFLASSQSKMITGISLKIDGGWTAN
jgi:NAD(P)-dependent dehydrogenase (short-subunit alcohol dehydrogenase family)